MLAPRSICKTEMYAQRHHDEANRGCSGVEDRFLMVRLFNEWICITEKSNVQHNNSKTFVKR